MTSTRPLGPVRVRRPRLSARLDEGVHHRLTVLTAPAGYGKKSLLDEWLATYDAAPFERVSFARLDDWPLTGDRVTAAVHALRERGPRAVLVLDGIDAPLDPAVVDGVVALAAETPPDVHVVVTRRSRATDPVLLQLRPSGHVQIGEDERAFTVDEAEELVRLLSGRRLDDAQVRRLLVRTEGWPVGIQLAAAGLRDVEDVDVDPFIDSFGAGNRHLEAFFVDEVLDREPTSTRRFLLQTSVLERLNGPLCDAVTGEHDGALLLRRLVRQGVFTQRVPGGGGWFLYHGLFRQLLMRTLRTESPGTEVVLRKRAGLWHADRGEAASAAHYLIEAEDWRNVDAVIERFGPTMFDAGRTSEVLRWFNANPASRDPSSTLMALRRAHLHSLLGETAKAENILHGLDARVSSSAEQVAVDAVRAAGLFTDAATPEALDAADRAVVALGSARIDEVPSVFGVTTPANVAAMANGLRARSSWYAGDSASARRLLQTSVAPADAHAPWRIEALGILALVEAFSGNLRASRIAAFRAFSIAGQAHLLRHPAMIDSNVAATHVARERGGLRSASRFLEEATAVMRGTHRPVARALIALEEARGSLASGQPELGLGTVDRYWSTAAPHVPPRIVALLRVAEAQLAIATGDVGRAETTVERASVHPCGDVSAVAVHLALVKEDRVHALALLDSWPAPVEAGDVLQRGLWSAILEFESGNRRRALEHGAAVVAEAEPEGHVRLFLDGGRPAGRLLRGLLAAEPTPYLRRLTQPVAAAEAIGPAGLGLSERELEVIAYLPTPLSSAEIASRLYISINTVKTHLRTIYRKLGVTSRREAIARVQELGLG